MREVTLRVDNMHCGSCVRRVTQALENTGGVTVDEVRIGGARVHLADGVSESSVLSAVEKAGFPVFVEP